MTSLVVVSFQNCGPAFQAAKPVTSSSLREDQVQLPPDLATPTPAPSATPSPSPSATPSPTPYPSNPIPTDAAVSTIASGFGFNEGPVWIQSLNALYFTDQSDQTVRRWDAGSNTTSLFRRASVPNGNWLAPNGSLYTLEGYPERRIAKTDLTTGATTTVVGQYDNMKFNSPNDISGYKDGGFYFTDPTYGGTPSGERELNFRGVFRVLPSGEVRRITSDFDQPNGIAFSPDYSILYVADSGRDEIRKFNLDADGNVVSSSIFYRPTDRSDGNAFDGIKVDIAGNLYTSGRRGITVLNPAGERVAYVPTNENTSNLAFGGSDRKTLFITCRTTVRKISVLVPGMAP